jgi:hypothetical protein
VAVVERKNGLDLVLRRKVHETSIREIELLICVAFHDRINACEVFFSQRQDVDQRTIAMSEQCADSGRVPPQEVSRLGDDRPARKQGQTNSLRDFVALRMLRIVAIQQSDKRPRVNED